jgi:hypothetical protein
MGKTEKKFSSLFFHRKIRNRVALLLFIFFIVKKPFQKKKPFIFFPGHAALTLRSRLRCIVMKKDGKDGQVTQPATNLLVLNEVTMNNAISVIRSHYVTMVDNNRDRSHIAVRPVYAFVE